MSGDQGATLVEFAFIAVLLMMLLMGIITYGIMLSFREGLTHSASEAARAAAVVQDLATTSNDERADAAIDAVKRFSAYGRDCGSTPITVSPGRYTLINGAMHCDIDIHDCNLPSGGGNPDGTVPDCITVALHYDYASNPVVPNVPLVPNPSSLDTSATAQISYPGAAGSVPPASTTTTTTTTLPVSTTTIPLPTTTTIPVPTTLPQIN